MKDGSYIKEGEIPDEIIDAANRVYLFFEKRGFFHWEFSHIADRRYLISLKKELQDIRQIQRAEKEILIKEIESKTKLEKVFISSCIEAIELRQELASVKAELTKLKGNEQE